MSHLDSPCEKIAARRRERALDIDRSITPGPSVHMPFEADIDYIYGAYHANILAATNENYREDNRLRKVAETRDPEGSTRPRIERPRTAPKPDVKTDGDNRSRGVNQTRGPEGSTGAEFESPGAAPQPDVRMNGRGGLTGKAMAFDKYRVPENQDPSTRNHSSQTVPSLSQRAKEIINCHIPTPSEIMAGCSGSATGLDSIAVTLYGYEVHDAGVISDNSEYTFHSSRDKPPLDSGVRPGEVIPRSDWVRYFRATKGLNMNDHSFTEFADLVYSKLPMEMRGSFLTGEIHGVICSEILMGATDFRELMVRIRTRLTDDLLNQLPPKPPQRSHSDNVTLRGTKQRDDTVTLAASGFLRPQESADTVLHAPPRVVLRRQASADTVTHVPPRGVPRRQESADTIRTVASSAVASRPLRSILRKHFDQTDYTLSSRSQSPSGRPINIMSVLPLLFPFESRALRDRFGKYTGIGSRVISLFADHKAGRMRGSFTTGVIKGFIQFDKSLQEFAFGAAESFLWRGRDIETDLLSTGYGYLTLKVPGINTTSSEGKGTTMSGTFQGMCGEVDFTSSEGCLPMLDWLRKAVYYQEGWDLYKLENSLE